MGCTTSMRCSSPSDDLVDVEVVFAGFMADLTQETQDCLDYFQQGIDKYLLQDWDGAKEMFEKSKELEPYKIGITPGVKDNPSSMLIERCMAMKWKPPGDDWDGVFVMTSK